MKLQAMPLPIAVLLKILNQRIFRPWLNIIARFLLASISRQRIQRLTLERA